MQQVNDLIGFKNSISERQKFKLHRQIVEQIQKNVHQHKMMKTLNISSCTELNIIKGFNEPREIEAENLLLDACDLRTLGAVKFNNKLICSLKCWVFLRNGEHLLCCSLIETCVETNTSPIYKLQKKAMRIINGLRLLFTNYTLLFIY